LLLTGIAWLVVLAVEMDAVAALPRLTNPIWKDGVLTVTVVIESVHAVPLVTTAVACAVMLPNSEAVTVAVTVLYFATVAVAVTALKSEAVAVAVIPACVVRIIAGMLITVPGMPTTIERVVPVAGA
jgi:hypothetical protein